MMWFRPGKPTGRARAAASPAHFLSAAGMVSGKHSFAFVSKTPFGSTKALSRLMKSMEKEGMLIKNSSILTSPQEAREIGKRLHVK